MTLTQHSLSKLLMPLPSEYTSSFTGIEQLRGHHWGLAAFSVAGSVVLELSDAACLPAQLFTQALLLLAHKGNLGRSSKALQMQFLRFLERGHKESPVHGLFFPSQLKEVDVFLSTDLLSSLRQNMVELKKTNNGEQGGREQNEK